MGATPSKVLEKRCPNCACTMYSVIQSSGNLTLQARCWRCDALFVINTI